MWNFTDISVHFLLFISLFFEVFLLITFFEKGGLRSRKSGEAFKPKRYPMVTVIVPCYNEERTIAGTLNSLLALDYPKDKLQILAVDDGSRDSTWRVLERFSKKPQIEAFQKENGGKHTALNFALAHARGEIIGCLDADSFVDPQALKEIIRAFEENPELKAVIPAIKVTAAKNMIQLIQKAEYTLSIFIRNVFSLIDANFVTPGPFSMFRREVFEKLGPYREAHNTEDLEMALRMQTNFMKIGNAPRAVVFTNTPRTYPALFKQRVRWTYGFIKNFFEYRHILFRPKYGNIGMFILPTAFLSIFSALYFTSLIVVSLAQMAVRKTVEVQTVGVSTPSFQFDWFFINTESVLFVTATLIAMAGVLILIGKSLAEERRSVSFDMMLYLFLYGFLAPWWLGRAVYNAALSQKSSWTSERN
jgi:cellulose synthase/poly-beta-1,6-N-acetylglucosamine synthase-like glycosyltransferase